MPASGSTLRTICRTAGRHRRWIAASYGSRTTETRAPSCPGAPPASPHAAAAAAAVDSPRRYPASAPGRPIRCECPRRRRRRCLHGQRVGQVPVDAPAPPARVAEEAARNSAADHDRRRRSRVASASVSSRPSSTRDAHRREETRAHGPLAGPRRIVRISAAVRPGGANVPTKISSGISMPARVKPAASTPRRRPETRQDAPRSIRSCGRVE